MWNLSESLRDVENGTSLAISFSLRNNLLAVNSSLIFLLGLAGLPTNVLNLLIFRTLGLDSSININFFALSTADFVCALLYIIEALILLDLSQILQLPMDLTDLEYLVASLGASVSSFGSWVTAIISVERCCCILLPVRVKHIFTRKLTVCLIVGMLVVQLVTLTASFSMMRLVLIRSPLGDRPKVGLADAATVSTLLVTLFFWGSSFPAFVCFALIVVSTIFLAITLRQRERWLQTLPGQRNENIEKNKKLVATVVAISAIYIACFLPGASTIGVYFAFPSLDAFNLHNEDCSYRLLDFCLRGELRASPHPNTSEHRTQTLWAPHPNTSEHRTPTLVSTPHPNTSAHHTPNTSGHRTPTLWAPHPNTSEHRTPTLVGTAPQH
ncbi:hypothetical protein RRG08_060267 [Elysia crispata]|uniref:G-protein coupled receptors family 1 profile domain-containing protein n=1 Tax=Elysia crispata TaxID=231223 RepID=A0AAE1B978_9GAST|nr:hypothetical protein RRG08_060267 [Elysia crispata]